MFSDILEKKELDRLFKTYNEVGKTEAGYIIIDIIQRLFKRKKETIRNFVEDTTVINIFKLNKQKKKLEKGYIEVLNFYKDLEKHDMETINIANFKCDELLDFLRPETRIIKEHMTAILQLYAGIFTLVIATIAIFFSIFL